ncbi:MAG: hypothetical protein AVDCRST_MAG59-601 [uncultured Thermomicrobiales bacterium]|uniref:Uncharacterized protein n=1 Tax=uncultured Thermomicrobiales bacterium TaxID=1645740 RepID=A0A6J4U308_9BACT|nr:MAG: hypothetical protein AVDCRST_MAG59-601 [uncultured Thermomicrobiales bacterium]
MLTWNDLVLIEQRPSGSLPGRFATRDDPGGPGGVDEWRPQPPGRNSRSAPQPDVTRSPAASPGRLRGFRRTVIWPASVIEGTSSRRNPTSFGWRSIPSLVHGTQPGCSRY